MLEYRRDHRDGLLTFVLAPRTRSVRFSLDGILRIRRSGSAGAKVESLKRHFNVCLLMNEQWDSERFFPPPRPPFNGSIHYPGKKKLAPGESFQVSGFEIFWFFRLKRFPNGSFEAGDRYHGEMGDINIPENVAVK